MRYKIRNDQLGEVKLCESDEVKSVMQNVQMILATRRGTVPMYRDFGLPMEFIDRNGPVAENILAAEVHEALEKYEPRALLKFVTVEHGADGNMNVILEVEI